MPNAVNVVEAELNRHFYEGGVVNVTKEVDTEGEGWWIVLHYANGGRVCVLTNRPLVWVDPEQH